MLCRSCGTEIADKAIVCFRCGEPTASPRQRAMGGARPGRPRSCAPWPQSSCSSRWGRAGAARAGRHGAPGGVCRTGADHVFGRPLPHQAAPALRPAGCRAFGHGRRRLPARSRFSYTGAGSTSRTCSMPDARLDITDAVGRRVVPVDKLPFTIGRRETNELRLMGSEVSRDHARSRSRATPTPSRIARRATGRSSTTRRSPSARSPTATASGSAGAAGRDGVPAGRSGAHDRPHHTTAIGDLRQVAALLEGLRALGSGRVLDDVLALVLDSAIEVGGASAASSCWPRPRGSSSSSWRAAGVARRCRA